MATAFSMGDSDSDSGGLGLMSSFLKDVSSNRNSYGRKQSALERAQSLTGERRSSSSDFNAGSNNTNRNRNRFDSTRSAGISFTGNSGSDSDDLSSYLASLSRKKKKDNKRGLTADELEMEEFVESMEQRKKPVPKDIPFENDNNTGVNKYLRQSGKAGYRKPSSAYYGDTKESLSEKRLKEDRTVPSQFSTKKMTGDLNNNDSGNSSRLVEPERDYAPVIDQKIAKSKPSSSTPKYELTNDEKVKRTFDSYVERAVAELDETESEDELELSKNQTRKYSQDDSDKDNSSLGHVISIAELEEKQGSIILSDDNLLPSSDVSGDISSAVSEDKFETEKHNKNGSKDSGPPAVSARPPHVQKPIIIKDALASMDHSDSDDVNANSAFRNVMSLDQLEDESDDDISNLNSSLHSLHNGTSTTTNTEPKSSSPILDKFRTTAKVIGKLSKRASQIARTAPEVDVETNAASARFRAAARFAAHFSSRSSFVENVADVVDTEPSSIEEVLEETRSTISSASTSEHSNSFSTTTASSERVSDSEKDSITSATKIPTTPSPIRQPTSPPPETTRTVDSHTQTETIQPRNDSATSLGYHYHDFIPQQNSGHQGIFTIPQTAHLGPGSVAAQVVSADALAAITAYNPNLVVLNEMYRQQLELVRQFVAMNQYTAEMHARSASSYNYTTLADTLSFIKANRRPPMTFDEAMAKVLQNED